MRSSTWWRSWASSGRPRSATTWREQPRRRVGRSRGTWRIHPSDSAEKGDEGEKNPLCFGKSISHSFGEKSISHSFVGKTLTKGGGHWVPRWSVTLHDFSPSDFSSADPAKRAPVEAFNWKAVQTEPIVWSLICDMCRQWPMQIMRWMDVLGWNVSLAEQIVFWCKWAMNKWNPTKRSDREKEEVRLCKIAQYGLLTTMLFMFWSTSAPFLPAKLGNHLIQASGGSITWLICNFSFL